MKTRTVTALVLIACGCGDGGPDFTLGAPLAFRLISPNARLEIGIDFEIRIPAGYAMDSSPLHRDWTRKNGPSIVVTTNPEEQPPGGAARRNMSGAIPPTFELPCGYGKDGNGGTNRAAVRIERPDDLTVVCESHDGTTLRSVRVVRLIKSIDTVIECEAHTRSHLASQQEREAGLAICGSLRVTGRAAFTRDDYDTAERGGL